MFDGECNLCNGAVDFLIRLDKNHIFRYASLQSDAGKKLSAEYGIPSEIDSIVLIYNGKWHIKSSALFIIIKELKWYWHIFLLAKMLPYRFLNRIYDWLAAHRYKLFGKRDTCRVPSEEERSLFL